jgi:hypothetical protein
MSLEWHKLYKLGTDVAGFVFFHPARLAHRKNDQFEAVSSIEDIPVPNVFPWLLASKSWHEKRIAQQSATIGATRMVWRVGGLGVSDGTND